MIQRLSINLLLKSVIFHLSATRDRGGAVDSAPGTPGGGEATLKQIASVVRRPARISSRRCITCASTAPRPPRRAGDPHRDLFDTAQAVR